jgi:hypothetical protein
MTGKKTPRKAKSNTGEPNSNALARIAIMGILGDAHLLRALAKDAEQLSSFYSDLLASCIGKGDNAEPRGSS